MAAARPRVMWGMRKPRKKSGIGGCLKRRLLSMRREIEKFDPSVPVEKAKTAPASWYTDEDFLKIEKAAVFGNHWLHVGHVGELPSPGSYIARCLLNRPYLLVRGEDGEIRAFYNVCSHHAMQLLEGEGELPEPKIVCPYHGWTYRTDGRLTKTVGMKGIEDFKAKENSLKPIHVDTIDGFIFVNFSASSPCVGLREWAGGMFGKVEEITGGSSELEFVQRKTYSLDCNWKVFVDNYCDGGYHVPYAHGGLNSGIDFDTYKIEMFDHWSMQSVSGAGQNKRLGDAAAYGFLYPNFMVNRYGPWMDTNTVIPIGPKKTRVIFDYFLRKDLCGDEEFIKKSMEESDVVQQEDEVLCAGVQAGLDSGAYEQGRYVPRFEGPMHCFHRLLYEDYITTIQ